MAEKQFPTDFSQISDIVDATTILVDDGSSNQYATAEQIQNYIETKSLVMSTGVFTVGNGTGSAQVRCDGAAGNGRYTTVRTNGITRWLYGGGSSAESGSDAGTPWHILAYDDAGDFIDTPISVTRASGGSITFNRRLQMSGKNINDVGSIEVGGDVVLNSSLPRLRMEDTDGTKATWLIQTGNELEIQRRNLSDGAYEAVALDINHDNEKITSYYNLDLNGNNITDVGIIFGPGSDDYVILAAENAAGASRIGAYGSTHASFADHVLYSSDNHLFNTATGTNIVEMYSDQCKLSAETKLSITGDDADPPSLSDGDIWHRTDLDELRIRLDGTTYSFDLTAV